MALSGPALPVVELVSGGVSHNVRADRDNSHELMVLRVYGEQLKLIFGRWFRNKLRPYPATGFSA
ncbi:hypothetical protein NC653_009407 [Populus alba x Populus x berolinensis]|uniref:Uncharacterized protein n=1 Tax=Populus alba x Populus x berolinensis TaxID=444605 RepID=A0AAD6W9P9_9ROSI|nr:hypothetical protein NC653_009407 [Populus alba x Populus x berolinensis]